MGTEVLIPLALTAAGSGIQAVSARNQARAQDREAARGIQQQAARQRLADEQVSAEIGAMERSDPSAARRQSTDAFLEQLRRTRGAATGRDPLTGGARFQEESSHVAPELAQYGANRADILGRITAPGLQRQGEGQSFGRLASRLSGIGRDSQGDAFINELRVRGIQRNPWVDALGGLMQNYGQAMAAGRLNPATKTTLPVPDGGIRGVDMSAFRGAPGTRVA